MFLEISQNSQEKICAGLFFNKVAGLMPATFKKWIWHRCFAVNFVQFLRTTFFIEHLRWLLRSFRKKVLSYMSHKVLITSLNLTLHFHEPLADHLNDLNQFKVSLEYSVTSKLLGYFLCMRGLHILPLLSKQLLVQSQQ